MILVTLKGSEATVDMANKVRKKFIEDIQSDKGINSSMFFILVQRHEDAIFWLENEHYVRDGKSIELLKRL